MNKDVQTTLALLLIIIVPIAVVACGIWLLFSMPAVIGFPTSAGGVLFTCWALDSMFKTKRRA